MVLGYVLNGDLHERLHAEVGGSSRPGDAAATWELHGEDAADGEL